MAIHLLLLCATLTGVGGFAGETIGDQLGRVVFGGLPVPGATVTASRDAEQVVTVTDQQGGYRLPDLAGAGAPHAEQVVTVTDQQGGYRLPDLADGVWTIRVEMLGFVTASQDVTIASGSPPITWGAAL